MDSTGVIPQPEANATYLPLPRASRLGVKLPFGRPHARAPRYAASTRLARSQPSRCGESRRR
jgi:hypothetical protein